MYNERTPIARPTLSIGTGILVANVSLGEFAPAQAPKKSKYDAN